MTARRDGSRQTIYPRPSFTLGRRPLDFPHPSGRRPALPNPALAMRHPVDGR